MVNDWSTVKISQMMKSDRTFIFKIELNDENLHEVVNTQPKAMSNTRAWAVPDDLPAALAKLRNIKLITHNCDYGKTWRKNGAVCTAGEILSSNFFPVKQIMLIIYYDY